MSCLLSLPLVTVWQFPIATRFGCHDIAFKFTAGYPWSPNKTVHTIEDLTEGKTRQRSDPAPASFDGVCCAPQPTRLGCLGRLILRINMAGRHHCGEASNHKLMMASKRGRHI